MRKTTLFKKYINDPKILVLPTVHDPLCAKIAQKEGFKAILTAGYANSAALLGKPDVELLTLTEMVDAAWRIVDAVDIPVFADGDTGHGNVTNVIRTVQQFEKAGVAGLFIEDQVSPKRCGHMEGKKVIPTEEFLAKIRAALDTRKDPDFVIMARTDALAVNGIDDAIERVNLCREEGADLLFVEAPQSLAQLKRIPKEVKGPTVFNAIEGGKTPIFPAKKLQELGFAVAFYPVANTYVIAKAVTKMYRELHKKGALVNTRKEMIEFNEFNALVGLPEIRATETKYYKKIAKN